MTCFLLSLRNQRKSNSINNLNLTLQLLICIKDLSPGWMLMQGVPISAEKSSWVNSSQIEQQIWLCQISFYVLSYVLDSSPCSHVDAAMSLAHASQTQTAAWGMPITCACVSVTSVSRAVNCVPQSCVRAQRHREVDSKERDVLAPLLQYLDTNTTAHVYTQCHALTGIPPKNSSNIVPVHTPKIIPFRIKG